MSRVLESRRRPQGHLQTAVNLYGTSFNVVRAAWAAISVPAQSGEATCSATAGSHRWDVYAYSGSGSFTLEYDVP